MAGVTPNTIAGRLNRIQSFKEVTWGTSGLATARWMAVEPTPQFTPIYKSEVIDEDRGSFAPSFVSYIPELGGAFNIPQTATFEDILFALAAIMGPVTPTGGPNYVYTHAAPLTSAWLPQAYSLELDYDLATVLATGCLANKLSLKFNAKNRWQSTLSGFYQQNNPYPSINIASSTNVAPIEITTATPLPATLVTGASVVISGHLVNTAANGTWTIIKTGASTFTLTGSTGNGVGGASGIVNQGPTPAIADRTVEPILFAGETALAIDPASTAPGTTPVTNAFVSGQLDIDNGLQGFFTSDQKYPVDFSQDKFKIDLTVRLKWNAQVKALYTSQWLQGNRTVWQIKATSGSKYCELDMALVMTSDPQNYALDYAAQTQELKFSGQYDATLANYLKAIVQNTLSAIP